MSWLDDGSHLLLIMQVVEETLYCFNYSNVSLLNLLLSFQVFLNMLIFLFLMFCLIGLLLLVAKFKVDKMFRFLIMNVEFAKW